MVTMSKRTKRELETENADLREQVALLRQVVSRMLVAPPTPAPIPVGVPFPLPVAPSNPFVPQTPTFPGGGWIIWPPNVNPPMGPMGPFAPGVVDGYPKIICGNEGGMQPSDVVYGGYPGFNTTGCASQVTH